MKKYLIKNISILLILVVGLILRLISINQSLWLDESTTALVAGMSFHDYIYNFSPNDFHPPVYYLTIKYISSFIGISEVALRSVSVISGMMTVIFAYLIGRKISERIGLLAALLLSISGLHIYYSQEARMYALATFFVAVSVYFYFKIHDNPSICDWLLFGVSIALATLTHYLTAFMLLVFWGHAILSKKESEWWRRFSSAYVILIILWIFWLPNFYRQLTAGLGVQDTMPIWWDALGKTSIKELVLVPIKFILGRISFDSDRIYGFVAITVVTIYGSALYKSIDIRKGVSNFLRDKDGIVWTWFALPILISALLGNWLPIFGYFRLMYVVPALYILVSIGISRLKDNLAIFVTCLFIMISLSASIYYHFEPKFHREDWRGLANFVSSGSSLSSEVLFVKNSQMEAYEYYKKRCENESTQCKDIPKAVSLGGLNSSNDRIWLMRYLQDVFDTEDETRLNIEKMGYKKINEHDFNGIIVWEYIKN